MLVRFAAVCSAAAALLASAAVAHRRGQLACGRPRRAAARHGCRGAPEIGLLGGGQRVERAFCAGFVARLAVANRDTNDLVALAATMIKDDLALRNVAPAKLSYSLQYLMLQQQMQNEGRAFTALSNIMKTKHDTVKNSISNVR